MGVTLALTALILSVAHSNRIISSVVNKRSVERVDDMKQSFAYDMLGSLALTRMLRRVAQVGAGTQWQLLNTTPNLTFSLQLHADESATLSITLCDPRALDPEKIFNGATNNEKLPDLSTGAVKDCVTAPPSLVDIPMVPDIEWYVRAQVTTSQNDVKFGPRRGSPALIDMLIPSAHAETCPPGSKCSEGSLTTPPPIPDCSLEIAPGVNPATNKRWDRIATVGQAHSQTKLIADWNGPIIEMTIRSVSYSPTGTAVGEEILHKTKAAGELAPYVTMYGANNNHEKGHVEVLAGGHITNIPPIPSNPHTNKWEMRVVGVDGVGEKSCFTTAKVVPVPQLTAPNKIVTDYTSPTFYTANAVFTDTDPTDDQQIKGTRSGISQTSGQLTGVNVSYNFPELGPSGLNPIYDQNHYYLEAHGYGGISPGINGDAGIRAVCSSHTNSPNSIFFTQQSNFRVDISGPWGSNPNPATSTATWNFDWGGAKANTSETIAPQTADTLSDYATRTQTGITAVRADGLGFGYNITSTFDIYNWAGKNSCPAVATEVKVTGTPTCSITLSPNPARVFINDAPLTATLNVYPPAGQPLNARGMDWGGPTYPGATKPVSMNIDNTDPYWNNESPWDPGYLSIAPYTSTATMYGYDSPTPFQCSVNRTFQCMIVPIPQPGQPQDGTQLIRWVYQYLLGRDWSLAGDGTYFLRQIAQGVSILNIMDQIKGSGEFAAYGGTTGWLVRAMYSMYLQRIPYCPNAGSPATCESKGWIDYINTAGGTYQDKIKWVASAILASPEAQSRGTCTDGAIAGCGPGNAYNWGNSMMVYLWYILFNTPGGIQQVVDLGTYFIRDGGYDLDGIFAAMRSTEIYNAIGGVKGEEARALYLTLLGRGAGLDEVLYWVNFRNAVSSIGNYVVAQEIRASAEYRNLNGCVLPRPDPATYLCPLLIADGTGRFGTFPVAVPWGPNDSVDPNMWNPNPDTPFAPENVTYLTNAIASWVPFGLFIGANNANIVGPPGYPPNNAFPGLPMRSVGSSGIPGKTPAAFYVAGYPGAFYTHDAGRTFVPCAAGAACAQESTNVYDPSHAAFWAQVSNIGSPSCYISDIVFRIHGCFAPDTPILRADGMLHEAQAIRKGDKLWDPVNGVATEVTEVTAGPEWIDLIEVNLAGRKIRVTEEHAFPTERGLLPASELVQGDKIRSNNRWQTVSSLRRVPSDGPVTVWNFALGPDDGKDRFVEAHGIVTGDLRAQRRLREARKTGASKL